MKGEVDIGLIPTTIYPITKVKVADCCIFQEILLEVMGELDISTRPANLPPKEDISGVMVKYMEVCPKRSKNRLC